MQIHEQYPLLNQDAELAWKLNKENEDEIWRSAMSGRSMSIKTRVMRPYILSNLCISLSGKSLPSLKHCVHQGKTRCEGIVLAICQLEVIVLLISG